MITNVKTVLSRNLESNKVQEVSGLFKRLTLDIIGTCGFGVATNCQRDRNNSLLQASEQLFNSHKTLFLYFPSLVFESLRRPVRQTMLFYFWIKAKLFSM